MVTHPSKQHVISDYAEIFDVRGRDYHQAMLTFPDARAEEFCAVVKHADVKGGQTICDYPAGGGYIQDFLPPHARLVLLETSKVFFQCASEHSPAERLLVKDGHIPLEDKSADRFISLAGLHHLQTKIPLFSEVYRCLKAGGIFTIADVRAGSGVDRFLNEFVHNHSEEGHEGLFLDLSTGADLESCGYHVRFMQPLTYPWKFTTIADMALYCRLMFGITRATPAQIEEAIRSLLGLREVNGEFHMMWELLFIVAEK